MWKLLRCSEFIDLNKTLFSGQVFHFKRINERLFIGSLYDELCILLQQDRSVYFFVTSDTIEEKIANFFNLDIAVEISDRIEGLRFLTNEIRSTIFSFICSSNNNIKRISSMVSFLYSLGDPIPVIDILSKVKAVDNITSKETNCSIYKSELYRKAPGISNSSTNNSSLNNQIYLETEGSKESMKNGLEAKQIFSKIDVLDSPQSNHIESSKKQIENNSSILDESPFNQVSTKLLSYDELFKLCSEQVVYKFPSFKKLAAAGEMLENNKFGYRAKFICKAAEYLDQTQVDWYNLTYQNAKKELLNIMGVGRKVADCICLIALKHFSTVPLDTHLIKRSKEIFNIETKNISDTLYNEIQKLWIDKYGKYAGIVQLHFFKRSVDARINTKRHNRPDQ